MEAHPLLPEPSYLKVGRGTDERRIAYRQRLATTAQSGLFWLGGFKSDMDGSKALALDAHAEAVGWSFSRFDYSGHGLSGGEFLDGTISLWLEEAEAIFAATQIDDERRVIIGSSMGGWLALLLNQRLLKQNQTSIAGLILIAPAVDMTADLMWDMMSNESKASMIETGQLAKPSDYSDEPYILTHKLIEDGRQHLFGTAVIENRCPVHILQGGQDTDVPPSHVLKLASQLPLDDVVLTIIPDGDHRLSRPQDLDRLIRSAQTLLG